MDDATAMAELSGMAGALGVSFLAGLGAVAAFLLGLVFLKLFGLVE